MDLEHWIPVIVSVVMSTGGWISFYALRKHRTIDLVEKLEGLYEDQLDHNETQKQKIADLEKALKEEKTAREKESKAFTEQLEAYKKKMTQWEAGIRILTDQLVANNIPVGWKPDA